jgi:hypothetical protein
MRQRGVGTLGQFLAAAIQEFAPIHSPQFLEDSLPAFRSHFRWQRFAQMALSDPCRADLHADESS